MKEIWIDNCLQNKYIININSYHVIYGTANHIREAYILGGIPVENKKTHPPTLIITRFEIQD